MDSFRCSHCHVTKPADAFAPSQRKSGSWCRDCFADDYRSKADAKKAYVLAYNRARNGRPGFRDVDCAECGTTFQSPYRRAKFCSTACKNREGNRNRDHRAANFKKYGLSVSEFEALKRKQRNSCRICKTEFGVAPRDCHIDHCHKTGTVRGLLCPGCNVMLGYARENPAILRAAARYLGQ